MHGQERSNKISFCLIRIFNALTSIDKVVSVKKLNAKQSNFGILDEIPQVNIDKLILIYIVNNMLFEYKVR